MSVYEVLKIMVYDMENGGDAWSVEHMKQHITTKKKIKLFANYGGTTIILTCYELIMLSINEILEQYIEEVVGEYQCGFERGRTEADQYS